MDKTREDMLASSNQSEVISLDCLRDTTVPGYDQEWERALPFVWSVAIRSVRKMPNLNEHDAQDLAIEAIERALRCLQENTPESYRKLQSFAGFLNLLSRSASCHAVDHVRRRSAGKRKGELLTDVIPEVVAGSDIDPELGWQDFEPYLQQLNEDERQFLRDRYLGGLTTTEIAEKFERNKNSVQTTIYRALKKLREMPGFKEDLE